jgi:hypothetical protein
MASMTSHSGAWALSRSRESADRRPYGLKEGGKRLPEQARGRGRPLRHSTIDVRPPCPPPRPVPGHAARMVMQWREATVAPLHSPRTGGGRHRVSAGVAPVPLTTSRACGLVACLRAQRVRVPWGSPYTLGRSVCCAHGPQRRKTAAGAQSCCPPAHPTSTRAAKAGSGFLPCFRGAGRSGHGGRWAHAAMASTGPGTRLAPCVEVWRAAASSAPGGRVRARGSRRCRDARWLVAPRRTAAWGSAPCRVASRVTACRGSRSWGCWRLSSAGGNAWRACRRCPRPGRAPHASRGRARGATSLGDAGTPVLGRRVG